MKKYYYNDGMNVYSNDPNIENRKEITTIYHCSAVVNKTGTESFAGGTAPWFCIKDGDMFFYKGECFKTGQIPGQPGVSAITAIDETSKYNRRIFSCTPGCLTDAWYVYGNDLGSWNARRKIPYLIKKELYQGKEKIVNVLDRFDEDGNTIGNKLSWKISTSNMKFYPTIEGPSPTNHTCCIKRTGYMGAVSYYTGNPTGPYESYTSYWDSNKNRATNFTNEATADVLLQQIIIYNQQHSITDGVEIELKTITEDPATSGYNFKAAYNCTNFGGFVAWSEKDTSTKMFTTNNWFGVRKNPLEVENTEFGFTQTSSDSTKSDIACPGHFTLDVTQVPQEYNKIDVVIDGVFYYPNSNYCGPHTTVVEDYSNVYNIYNYNHDPIPSFNCWAYLYKPDNNTEWKFQPKYGISARRTNKTQFYKNGFGPTVSYSREGWGDYPQNIGYQQKEDAEAFLTKIINDQDPNIDYTTLDICNLSQYQSYDFSYPSADYLGYSFTGNIKYDKTITTPNKMPWYNDENTTYKVKEQELYDNSHVPYSLYDVNFWEHLLVNRFNTNNDGICKFEVDLPGQTTPFTGYTYWDNLSSYVHWNNIRVTAYSAGNTSPDGVRSMNTIKAKFVQHGRVDALTSATFDADPNVIDYTDYFNNTNDTPHISIKDFNTDKWQELMSKFKIFTCSNSYDDSNAQYLYIGSRLGDANIVTYGAYQETMYGPINNKWNPYGFTLTSFQAFNLANVTMKHQIDLGTRTTTGGFTFTGNMAGDYKYLHISYPATNTVNTTKSLNLISQIDMYYKFIK